MEKLKLFYEKYKKNIERQNEKLLLNGISLSTKIKERFYRKKIMSLLVKSKQKKIIDYFNLEGKMENILKNRKLNLTFKNYRCVNSLKNLVKFVNYRNILCRKKGFKNYSEILEKKVEIFINHKFNIEEWIKSSLKNISCFYKNFKKKETKEVYKLDEGIFCKVLKDIDEKLYNLYQRFKENESIVYDCDLDGVAGLVLYFPIKNNFILCFEKERIETCFDFVAHELGHVCEKLFAEKNKLDQSMFVNGFTGEVFSSIIEWIFLCGLKKESQKNSNDLVYCFKTSILSMAKKIYFENYLNKTNEKIDRKFLVKIKTDWENLLKNCDINIEFNQGEHIVSYDMCVFFNYFIGKKFALNYCRKKFVFKDFKSMCAQFDVFDLVKYL